MTHHDEERIKVLERALRDGYRSRSDVSQNVEALLRHGFSAFTPPDGGFNVWLELAADGPTSTELYLEAVRRGVAFVPGPFFFSAGGATSPAAVRGLRLSYSALAPDALRRGVGLLGDALQSLRGGARVEQVVY